MRKGIFTAVVAVAVLACAGVAGAAQGGFKSPSGHIRCFAITGKYAGIRCDIDNGTYKPPKVNCHGTGDSGFSFGMGPRGRSRALCVSDALPPIHRTLAYGHRWRLGSFRCLSQTKGVTCRNRSNHGFFLSRQRYRLF